MGAERLPQKTEVIYYVTDLDTAPLTGKTAMFAFLRLFMGTSHWDQYVADQLLATADVTRAMREHVQLCQDQWYVDDGALQKNGGRDDGDILCHPMLVLSYLQAFDKANV